MNTQSQMKQTTSNWNLRFHLILSFFFIFSFIFSITPVSAQNTDQPVYQYWADENYPPFEFKDPSGNAAGFSVDIIRAVGEEIGFSVNSTPHPWNDVKAALTNKTIDLSGTMVYDINRTDRFVFSVPIITLNWYLYVRQDSPITSLDDLKGKRIILAKGDIWEEKLSDTNFPAEITIAPDYRQQLMRMSEGGYDAAIINKPVALYLMDQLGIRNLKAVGDPVDRMSLCIAAHVSNPELIGKINEGIVIINRNGKYEEISRKWFAPEERQVESEIFQKVFLFVLLPVSGLILLIFFWIWTLRKVVASRTADLKEELAARITAEKAREISETRYSLTLEAINDGMWDWNVRTGSAFFSPQYYRMAGYAPGEFPADYKNWRSRIHEQDLTEVERKVNRGLSDGTGRYTVEFRFRKKDGTYLWIQARGRVVEYDADNQALRMVGTHTDITEQKKIQDALNESERIHKTLIDNLEGMVYRCRNDPDWTMEYISDGVYPLTGYLPEEMLFNRTISFGMIIHPDDQESTWRFVQEEVKQNNPYRLTYRIIRKDGTVRWVWEQGRGIFRDNQLEALEGYIADITREIEDQESLKRMGYSIEHLNEGIIWFDEQGQITETNIAFEQLTGGVTTRGTQVHDLPFILQAATWTGIMDTVRTAGSSLFDATLDTGETEKYIRLSISYCEFGEEIVYCAIIDDRTAEERSIRDVLYQKEILASINEELLSSEEELRNNYDQLQHTQSALELSEKKFRSIFEDSILGIFQTDMQGGFLELNPAFARIYGFSTPEAMKETHPGITEKIFVKPGDYSLIFDRLALNGEIRGFETEQRQQDGSSVWISMNMKIVRSNDGTPLFYEGTIEDITRRIRAEQENEITLRQIQKNFAELSILNDGIRNPLTVIATIAESLNEQNNQIVQEQITQIDTLINQLDLRWIESEKIIRYLKKHHDIEFDNKGQP